jgi:hypothetical protein
MKLNLDRHFYIGGVPNVEDGLVIYENFTGCIENMYLNHSNVIAAFKDQFGYDDEFYNYGWLITLFWCPQHISAPTDLPRYVAGLPDFSWSKIPKRGKIYQITTKYTKLP